MAAELASLIGVRTLRGAGATDETRLKSFSQVGGRRRVGGAAPRARAI
jgi:hypothetical protein